MIVTTGMNANELYKAVTVETNRRVGAEAAERGLSASGMCKLIGKHYGPVAEQVEQEVRQLHSADEAARLIDALDSVRKRMLR